MRSSITKQGRALVLAVAVLAIASLAYASDPIDLVNGVPVSGLSGTPGSEVFYKIAVPTGQGELEISISGGTGDCDLYVRHSGLPSYNLFDRRPLLFGNDETVTIADPEAGTWYIMLRGHENYSGVTLLATSTAAVPTELENGVPVEDISGSHYTAKYYTIDVPAGQSSLQVATWDGSGDVDLYVKRGSAPGQFDFDGRSFGGGTFEEVTIDAPAAGTWYIMLLAADTYHNVTLRAVYGSSGTTTHVGDEVPITDLSGAAGSEALFVFDVPGDDDGVSFVLSGGTGDCDMYIKKGAQPTTSDWDYRPEDNGNFESISISGSDMAGRWYVLLVGDQAYSDVTLTVHHFRQNKAPKPEAKKLTAGVAVTDLAGKAGSEQLFSIEVPNTVQTLTIQMSGGTGDADLYIRKGEIPTTSQYDFRPYLTGNNEQVILTKAVGGTWYILVRGYQAFTGVTLVATFDAPVPDGATVLLNGVAVNDLAGLVASQKFFKIEVPAGQTKLEIALSGGTGDADLYVRVGEKPTTKEWDYRPFRMGNKETVTIDNPKAGTYYLMIRAYMAYAGLTLKATYGPDAEQIQALENGVPVANLSGAQDSEIFFKIDVPAGQESLRFEISGGTGDADLFVKKGEKPTTKSFDYHPGLHGNDEKVEILSPAGATWYVMIRGYQAYAGVSVQACFQAPEKTDEGDDGSDEDCGCTINLPGN